jgi:hypothetical protein
MTHTNILLTAGGVAQVIEHLPSKYKALSSNSSTANKVYIFEIIHISANIEYLQVS